MSGSQAAECWNCDWLAVGFDALDAALDHAINTGHTAYATGVPV